MFHLDSLSAIILDTSLKATVLLLLGWTACALMKDRSAAARHLVQTCFLAALLLLPFSTLFPGWHVRGLPRLVPALGHTTTASPAEPAQAWPASFASDPPIVRPAAQRDSLPARSAATKPRLSQPLAGTSGQASAGQSPVVASVAPRALSRITSAKTSNSLFVLAVVWLIGTLVFAFRAIADLARLAKLVQRATPVRDPACTSLSAEIAQALGVRRPITLLESSETDVPLACGALHAAVILPADHGEWSTARCNTILHHEIAHIKRLDTLTQFVAQSVTVLYWFHPLVWLMARAMRAERERACDDQVLAAGTKASDYAHELLDIVSSLRRPELAAALAMARRSQLEGRVLAVLNPSLHRGPVSWKTALGVAALTLSVMLPLAALRPAPQSSTPTPGASGKQKPTPASTPSAQPNNGSAPGVAGTPAAKPDD